MRVYMEQQRQHGRDRYNSQHTDQLDISGEVLYVAASPLGRIASGPYKVVGRENNMIDLQSTDGTIKRVALSQVVEYKHPSDNWTEEIWLLRTLLLTKLLSIPVNELKKGDLILIRRLEPGGEPEDTTITLEMGRVTNSVHDVRLIEYELFASDESNKWRTTKIRKAGRMVDVLITGFTLTNSKHIRAKDNKL